MRVHLTGPTGLGGLVFVSDVSRDPGLRLRVRLLFASKGGLPTGEESAVPFVGTGKKNGGTCLTGAWVGPFRTGFRESDWNRSFITFTVPTTSDSTDV